MQSGSSLSSSIEKEVRPWLQLAEELRALGLDQQLAVPQIAVMGDQSSGKSSVLEALCGVPFPRGSGLVTRCPVRLVMRKSRTDEWSAVATTTAASAQRHVVSSPAEIADVIRRLTANLTNTPDGFSTESIIVELTSADAPDLTVVDLPGIIRTTTAGQSSGVINQVNRLIESYLHEPRTIILAVVPANQDIATVDILERAQRVDPLGERTIGVLTKADLVGPGSEAEVVAVLNNVRKPLALGYIMLRNRTQRELEQGVDNAQAKEIEAELFRTHPYFSKCESKLLGIDNLTSLCTNLLVSRIQRALAPMTAQVEQQLAETRAELKALGGYAAAETSTDRQKLLVTVVQEYVRQLTDCVRGEYRDRLVVRNPDLRLYTRALRIFDGIKSKVQASAPAFKEESFIRSLATQIEQLRGRELPGFMSSQAFCMCMATYVDQWRMPARNAVVEIQSLTQEVTAQLADALIVQFPALRESIRDVCAQALEIAAREVVTKVEELLNREKDPFTVDDFLQQCVNKIRYDRFEAAVDRAFAAVRTNDNWNGAKEDVAASLRQWYRATHAVSAMANAQDMSAILEAYWTLAAKRFVDNVCMIIDRDLMIALPRKVQDSIYGFVQDEQRLAELFTEDASISARRAELLQRSDRLMAASVALSKAEMSSSNARAGAWQHVTVSVVVGPEGLGVTLADESNRVVIRGFRQMANGAVNPGQQAGLRIGDIVHEINGQSFDSFTETVARLKEAKGMVSLGLLRRRL